MRNLTFVLTSFVVAFTLGACASKSDGEGDGDDTMDPGDDDPGVTCVNPDDGVGEACFTSDDCECGALCAQRECVAPSACNEALVTWFSPIQNTDGTCLTNMAGFRVYWGSTPGGPYENMMDLGMPCIDTDPVLCAESGETAFQKECSFRLTDLPDGDLYFVMTTYNTELVESVPSNEAMKVISCQ